MQRELNNVRKSITAMERLLSAWSTRRLTLLGRILIIKTFAVSQIVYLMQSLTLSEASYNAIIKVIFKYLWNKNYNAAKDPERLKRSIMLTPINLGGFGMIDVRALGKSLDLRSYGRLLISNHPFFVQVKGLIDSSNFLNVVINASVDEKCRKSIMTLNELRVKMLRRPIDVITSNVNFR